MTRGLHPARPQQRLDDRDQGPQFNRSVQMGVRFTGIQAGRHAIHVFLLRKPLVWH